MTFAGVACIGISWALWKNPLDFKGFKEREVGGSIRITAVAPKDLDRHRAKARIGAAIFFCQGLFFIALPWFLSE